MSLPLPPSALTINHPLRKLIEKYLCAESNIFSADHGWKTSSVPVPLPHEQTKFWSSERDPSISVLMVDGVHHCDITNIIISMFQDAPFEEYWKPDPGVLDPIRVFGEAYTSPQYLDAYQQVNFLPHKDGDDLERVVVPLMLWSNATHLTNFGDASLWPLYMFFENESKYTHGKPTAAACHHVADIPTLPDNFQDEYSWYYNKGPSGDIYTHCKCELMQAVWRVLLDEKFVILLVCIKFLGQCPCPRFLVKKVNISEMGTLLDMTTQEHAPHIDDNEHKQKVLKAHKQIFKHGASINGICIKEILASKSLVPTINAFSERIQAEDEVFNFFCLFVVDLLHEFELGVWKAVFIHLMCILHAVGGTAVQQLNFR
ncbi:hypothetical protein BS17DRAFT_853961 [Gyrodon lividus]|nr:hypothetical protein BS17DRAFT_853961 [Gyrodon lividus]